MQNFKIPEDKKKDLEDFKQYITDNSKCRLRLMSF